VKNLYGNIFSYRGADRRIIINNIANKINNLETLKNILRYNGYKKINFYEDPSSGDPSKGISSRSDLSRIFNLSGGTDTKITNEELVFKMTSIAISGPTTENNENLPVFDFKKVDPNNHIKRDGVPERFDFPYILMNPNTICCENKNDIYKFEKENN